MYKFKSNTVALLSIFLLISCQINSNSKQDKLPQNLTDVSQDLQEYETAYFASGCFWCVEAIFESVVGVKEVVSGYSGGKEENPTYQQVGRGLTSHAEAVEVYYDPEEVSFETLVKVFFGSQDPTTLNRQGPDRGAEYRSIAFYKNPKEQQIITNYIKELESKKVFDKKIVTEVVPFEKFWKAEDYHQDYEKKHPNNAYIRNVSIPRLKKFQKKFPDLLKKDH
ncbi:peptide-methionine (S)-S-oxide reductase MsrA [Ascidiimonas sp. W6]|uniref:peptide-methionine (S)-S-oxide reductase MsrA n=1 Tax=Ascidiimonas meishanensis TaxID=3128903 RepID=UPI0030EE5D28